jgi:type IV pilus assembly protein PilC
MLAEQTEKKALKTISKDIREEVQKGSSLSQAMSLHSKKLPSILINMIAAGEASGTLDNSLDIMSEHFEKEHKTQQKVKSAMRYPMIVGIIAVVVVVVMLTFVVPTFIGMFESAGAKLPLLTRILISMSKFVKKDGILLLGGVIILFILLRLFLLQESGRLAFDRLKFKLPVLGKFLKKTIAVRFARTMSTLLSTGVSITEALEITGKVIGNTFAKKGVDEVIEQVKQGKGLYFPMKSLMLFPAMLTFPASKTLLPIIWS